MTESTSQVFTAHPPDDPLGGSALDGLLSWAEAQIFIQQQSTRAQRRVLDKLPLLREQVRNRLEQHHNGGGFVPTRLLQLQRLHQLWLELGQPSMASALIDQWADAIIQAISDKTARNQAHIELLLADSHSRWHFDQAAGLAKLDQAAHLIRALPADPELANALMKAQHITRWHPSVERYWDHWQCCVENVYHNWQLAQHGLDWEQAQKQASISSPNYDPAWDLAKTCLGKAHIARRAQLHLEKEGTLSTQERADLEGSIADNVQAAITHMEHMRYEEKSHFLWNWNTGFSWRWMDLADELLVNNLQPSAVPIAMQALNRYWAQVEGPIEAKLAAFIPDKALLKAARQSVHTFRAIHQQQKLCLAAVQTQANNAQNPSYTAVFEHAQKGYYNINGGIDSPHDRFGMHLMAVLEATGQWQGLANMALHAVLDYRKGAAQAAYLLAKRALQQPNQPDKSIQLAWHIIMLQACRCPVMSDLLAKDGHEMPPHSAPYYLETARAISPDNLLIDRVQGVYLAQQKQWKQALPLLEDVVSKRPDWASSDVLLALWASRFAVLGVEAALKQSCWNHAGAACWGMQVAHHLQYPDYVNWPPPYASAQTWPLAQLQPLIHHYLTLAQSSFDAFWHAWKMTYIEQKIGSSDNEISKQTLHFCNSTHLIDYSDLCLELAADYFAKGKYIQARNMYQKGIATLYAEHFYIHARGLHECAVALGKSVQAQLIQKELDKMS